MIAANGEVYMIYFLLAVFLGPFYLLNLVLAVVSASYEGEVNAPYSVLVCTQCSSVHNVSLYKQQNRVQALALHCLALLAS